MVRKIFFWAHLVTALIVGLVVSLLLVTGLLLAFEKQLTAWADKDARSARPEGATERLTPAELLGRARAADPLIRPEQFMYPADPDAPVIANLRDNERMRFNAYTGEALGEGSVGTRAFMKQVRNLHTDLLTPHERGQTSIGATIVGVGNGAFVFIILSGLILWVPRQMRWAAIRSVLLFNFKLRGKPREWNWHNVIGIWCLIPLLFMAGTGVILSYRWANALLYRSVGSELKAPAPQPARPPANQPTSPRDPDAPNTLAGTDAAWKTALAYAPNWKALTVRVPPARPAPKPGEAPKPIVTPTIQVMVDLGSARQVQQKTTLTIAPDGTISQAAPFSGLEAGARARAWARHGHTGEAFGIIGQVIAALGCLGGIFLVYTGVALSLRRYAAWRARRRSMQNPAPAILEPQAPRTP